MGTRECLAEKGWPGSKRYCVLGLVGGLRVAWGAAPPFHSWMWAPGPPGGASRRGPPPPFPLTTTLPPSPSHKVDVGTRCWQLPPGGGLPRVYLELRAASLSSDGDRGSAEGTDDAAAAGGRGGGGGRGEEGGGERGSTGCSNSSGGSGENRTARARMGTGTGGSPLAAWLYKAEYRPLTQQAVSEGDAEGQELHPAAGKPFATWLYKKAYCPPSPSAVLSSTTAPAVLEADSSSSSACL